MIPSLSNPKRGCGTKIKGGFYFEQETSEDGGMLRLLTYSLGDGIDRAIFAPIKSRGQEVGSPACTHMSGNFVLNSSVTPSMIKNAEYVEWKNRTTPSWRKDVAVYDYVGSGNYTPMAFLDEFNEHGASRRVNKDMAKMVMQEVGVPFLLGFVMKLPLFYNHHLDTITQVLTDHYDFCFNVDPVYEHPRWQTHFENEDDKGAYRGDDSMMLYALKFMGEMDKDEELKEMYGEYFTPRHMIQQVFFYTWITKISYCADMENDDAQYLNNLALSGFNVGTID